MPRPVVPGKPDQPHPEAEEEHLRQGQGNPWNQAQIHRQPPDQDAKERKSPDRTDEQGCAEREPPDGPQHQTET